MERTGLRWLLLGAALVAGIGCRRPSSSEPDDAGANTPPSDAGITADAAVADAGATDAAIADAAVVDAAVVDAAVADAAVVDAAVVDAAVADAAVADAAPACVVPTLADAGTPERTACIESHLACVGGTVQANPDVDAVLAACPSLASALTWVDPANSELQFAAWPDALRARLRVLYAAMLAGQPLPSLACPDPRGADADRVPTAAGLPDNPPMAVYFTAEQAADMFLASVAHALALEVRHDLPWSLLDFPPEELGVLLSSRVHAEPVSQPPRPFGGPLPGADYQVPIAHVNALGFACDPRDGWDFIRGTTSSDGSDLLGTTPQETLANLAFFLARNSVHGFPLNARETVAGHQFTVAERLHLGLDFTQTPPATATTLVERFGCHSTAELLEELARAANIPVLNVGSYSTVWSVGTDYSFRQVMHRGLAFAWSRPADIRILPHADFVNATGLWPNYHAAYGAQDHFDLVWRTPDAYVAMGLTVDTAMPVVPVLPSNSDGAFETYRDFGRVFALLGTEGRYWLRRDACSWDMAHAWCMNPGGGADLFVASNPYGGYPEFATPALAQAAYDAIEACVLALPGGCSDVPAGFPSFDAVDWLP